ncbi:SMC-Scp complex subunit ScpB [Paracoccus aminophilus]|uniref:Segregation and condensation protein B n=1 Tax=Paracoccus aminophilus JCM 7686 TaxID=1367847 RepID=S5Y9Y9_PARAH|nr:SMC-Scp complex subunit ScpB [Paracoccus aminophilus]AGT08198.1 segregation and condensation protein B [Paracoccus aminophilus JCM 7686]
MSNLTKTSPTPDDAAADADPNRFPPPPLFEQERMVEAILFASNAPMTMRQIAARMPAGCDPAEVIYGLKVRYEGRGVHLGKVGDAWAFRTAGDLGFLMEEDAIENRRLSRAATETLAVIAYHQPVTRAEIEEIRGVTVNRGTLDQLIEMGWVRIGRRRMSPGRPSTFVVTEEFLDHFGLESARDLPGLTELRAAGLLESRPPASALPADLFPERQPEDEPTGPADDLFDDE